MTIQRKVTFRIDDARFLRFTLGAVTAVDMARYRRGIREAMAWRDETFGEPDLDAPYPTRAQDKITVAFSRAVVMGAVQSVESGICAEDQDEPETWTACEFPQEWEPVAEYVANMPGELHEALQLQAVVCNPNAFYSGGDDPKKVMPGSVSVT